MNANKKFDNLPQYPRKFDRGYSGKLSKIKKRGQSHDSPRCLEIYDTICPKHILIDRKKQYINYESRSIINWVK